MTRKLAVVHIGLAKTGTSSIQQALAASRESLLAMDGILYPDPPLLHEDTARGNHSQMVLTLAREHPERLIFHRLEGRSAVEVLDLRDQQLTWLRETVRTTDFETLLISAEGASMLDPGGVERFCALLGELVDDIRVIATVRHPVDWTRSMVQEGLKRGTTTLSALLNNPPLPRFRERLGTYLDLLGPDRLDVATFESARLNPEGLVGDFLNRVRPDIGSRERVLEAVTVVNPSLSGPAVEILDAMNRLYPAFLGGELNPARRSTRDLVALLHHVSGPRHELPASTVKTLILRTEEDIAWLNGAFGLDLCLSATVPRAEAGCFLLPEETADGLAAVLMSATGIATNAPA